MIRWFFPSWRLLHILANAAREADATLFASALMGNHYHLVAKSDYEKLPIFAYRLNCTYATHFNNRRNRKGHLFETRYKSQSIDGDAYFLEAIRYVHRNPVAAHLSPDCNYPWSSYPDYLVANTGLASSCSAAQPSGQLGSQQLARPQIADTARIFNMLGGPKCSANSTPTTAGRGSQTTARAATT